jgi:hypothetical protein
MLRKLLLGVALAALTLGTASVASANHQDQPLPLPPPPGQPQPFPTQPLPVPAPRPQPAPHFHVVYRICEFEPWAVYGTYDCHKQSHDVARALQRRGYEARVIHH